MNQVDRSRRSLRSRLGRLLWQLGVTVVFLELLVHTATWWFQVAPLVVAEPSRGWRMAPGAKIPMTNEEGPYLFRVNSEGRRDHLAHPTARTDRKRILVLGGSNTVGVSVPVDDIYTQVLQRAMPDVDVINLGVVLYELDQQLVLLREELPLWKPDLVIHLVNQDTHKYIFRDYEPRMGLPRCRVEATSEVGGYRLMPPRFPWWQPLASKSALLTVFDLLLYRRWSIEGSASESSPMTPTQEKVVRRLLLDVRDAASSEKARYLAVMASAPGNADGPNERSILKQLADSGEITFVDLGHLFVSHGPRNASPPLSLQNDPGHWSVYGHYAVAKELHLYLTQSPP